MSDIITYDELYQERLNLLSKLDRYKKLYEAEKARREAGEDVIMRYVPVSAVDTKSYSDWKNAIAAHEAVMKEAGE